MGAIRHVPDKSIRHLVKSALGQLDTNHWLIQHNISCFLFQWMDAPDTSCMHTNWFNPVYVPVPSFRNKANNTGNTSIVKFTSYLLKVGSFTGEFRILEFPVLCVLQN